MRVSHVQNISFRLLDWQDLAELTEDLAKKIRSEDMKPDRLVALANGGLTMVRHLADILEIERISFLQVKSYTGINENISQPRIEQDLQIDVENERLLVFEDIVDTGHTLKTLREYLPNKKPSFFSIAALIEKSHTTEHAEYVGAQWNEWIIFPYETRETIQALQLKWKGQGREQQGVVQDLREIGFSEQHIRQFSTAYNTSS